MPKQSFVKRFNLREFWELMERKSVRKGDLCFLEEIMAKHKTFFIDAGIYLIVEKLKLIAYRNFFTVSVNRMLLAQYDDFQASRLRESCKRVRAEAQKGLQNRNMNVMLIRRFFTKYEDSATFKARQNKLFQLSNATVFAQLLLRMHEKPDPSTHAIAESTESA